MGHKISKQQNQQMSDGQQMMSSSIEQHIDSSTTAKDLQVKIGKNKRIASKTNKLKKRNIKCLETTTTTTAIVPTKTKLIATSKSDAINLLANQDRSTGTVVITIRLLKMESVRSFDAAASISGDLTQNNNCSKLDCLPTVDKPKLKPSEVSHKNNRNQYENSSKQKRKQQHKNHNLKSDNNNVSSNQIDNLVPANCQLKEHLGTVIKNNRVNVGADNENDGHGNKRHSITTKHLNPALHSEVPICDKVQINCTSQMNELPSNKMVNCLTQTINTINLTDSKLSTDANQLPLGTDAITQIKTRSLPDSENSTISSNLISSVSPYPHHFPIANIIRSDCLNAIVGEHSSQSHQAKSVGSSNCENPKRASKESKESKELKTKKQNWGTKFNCTKLKSVKSLSPSSSASSSEPTSPSSTQLTASNNLNSVNTDHETTMNAVISSQKPTALLLDKSALFSTNGGNVIVVTVDQQQPWFAPDKYLTEDYNKKVRLQRAIEMAESVESPTGFYSTSSSQSLHSLSSSNIPLLPSSVSGSVNDSNGKVPTNFQRYQVVCSEISPLRVMPNFWPQFLPHLEEIPRIHSQMDFIHYLVPDLKQITNCTFYWGKMDRYEAERLLENKQEGTFLLRDSAQEDFLFSVSFRKYNRSLHARIEQLNHEFSFDCHDKDVFQSKTVTGLLEHYKDPSCVMFFEPALTLPLNRNFVFSLQQLCRATIVSCVTYDGVDDLRLPAKLKTYLKEYHYKQCYRTKQFDEPIYSAT